VNPPLVDRDVVDNCQPSDKAYRLIREGVCSTRVSSASDEATVLVIDDEEEVADIYALRLRDQYETRIAYGGEEGLEKIDDAVDIVLLDRRMPNVSGDRVLERIREGGFDCRVIMLTAVDPGLDIVDMPFDDYLCKPVEKDDLVDAIEQQLRLHRHDERLSEYLEATSKLSLLRSELPPQEREDSEQLDALEAKVDGLRTELEAVENISDIEDEFRDIGRRPK
jgi:DNA-binding response OmpR family regulator